MAPEELYQDQKIINEREFVNEKEIDNRFNSLRDGTFPGGMWKFFRHIRNNCCRQRCVRRNNCCDW